MDKHGHVTPNADGSLAKCGGPALCSGCREEYRQVHGREYSMPEHRAQILAQNPGQRTDLQREAREIDAALTALIKRIRDAGIQHGNFSDIYEWYYAANTLSTQLKVFHKAMHPDDRSNTK